MEEVQSYTTNQPSEELKKRPKMLQVLCILSFIGCSLIFIGSIIGIIYDTPENREKNIEQTRQFSPAAAEKLEAQYQEMEENVFYQIQPYLNILLCLTSFLGAFMMFKLQRKGFFVYAVSEIIPYTFSIFTGLGSISGNGISIDNIAWLSLVVMLAFDLVFIVLYATNLKHMR